MAYTDLQENTKIRASVLNANFDALRGELQEIGAGIQTDVSTQMTSTTSTMSTQITQMTDAINNCVKLSGTQTISGNKTFTGTLKTSEGNVVSAIECSILAKTDSSSPRGKVKLSNKSKNWLMQWGYKTHSAENSNVTVTFPSSFTGDNTYCFVMTTKRSGMGSDTPVIISQTSSSVVMRGDSNETVYWMAIGY